MKRLKEFPQLTWKVKHMRVPELSHPQRILHIAQALKKRTQGSRIRQGVWRKTGTQYPCRQKRKRYYQETGNIWL